MTMELTKKQRTIKYVLYCAMLLVANLLQNTGGLFPSVFSAHCLLLIPLAVTLAMHEGELEAGLLGLFAGLMWDLVSADHLGFNSIFLTLCCVFAAYAAGHWIRSVYLTDLVMCILFSVLYCFLYWLLFLVIFENDKNYASLWTFYLPSAVYTAVMSAAVVFFTRLIRKNALQKLNPNG